MNAKKCDRCGKYYDLYEMDIPERYKDRMNGKMNFVALHGKDIERCDGMPTGSSRPIDLCPDCMEKLISFLDEADINNLTPCIKVNIDGEKVGEAMKILKEGINLDWKPCCTSVEDDMQEHGCADS